MRALDMRRDDSNAIGVVDCEVRVDEDQDVCDGRGQRKSRVEQRPGVWIRVEDDGEKRWWKGLLGSQY